MCYEEIKKSFNTLSPNTAFWLGFIGAILALCALGFLVFLGMILKGNLSLAERVKAGDTPPIAVQDQAANPSPADNELTEPVVGQVAPVTSRDHLRGNSSAKVTLIEYSDFECPYCKRFHDTMKQVVAAYSSKVKWVYRHYPLEFHANAQKEAEASECAYELGGHEKFWQYADKIYERTTSNGTGFALTDLPKLAKELGLNQKNFETCLNSGKYRDYVSQAASQAQVAGIQGTPGAVLITAKDEKRLIKGALPLEMMEQIIDEAL